MAVNVGVGIGCSCYVFVFLIGPLFLLMMHGTGGILNDANSWAALSYVGLCDDLNNVVVCRVSSVGSYYIGCGVWFDRGCVSNHP